MGEVVDELGKSFFSTPTGIEVFPFFFIERAQPRLARENGPGRKRGTVGVKYSRGRRRKEGEEGEEQRVCGGGEGESHLCQRGLSHGEEEEGEREGEEEQEEAGLLLPAAAAAAAAVLLKKSWTSWPRRSIFKV